MKLSYNQHLVVAPCPLYLTSVWLSARRSCTEKSPIWKLCHACWVISLQWRHNESDGVSNHRRLDFFLNYLFRRRSTKTSKPSVTGRCNENSPVTGDFPAQRASNAENVSIRWRQHVQNWQKIYILFGWFRYSFILMNVYIQLTITRNYR